MFKQFISNIPGADSYMIFSLLTFMVFFTAVGLYMFWMDRKHVDRMKNLPFEK
jgi:cbb3-type cytochrome oxidase subunit 3